MVQLVGILPYVALIARNRIRRAWTWWAAMSLTALAFGFSMWAGAVALVLTGALIVDAILVAVRPVPAGAATGTNLRWLHLVAMMVASVGLALGLRLFVVEAFKIPSAGMLPALEIGDHVMADKLGLRFGGPRVGDMLVFRNPCTPEKDFVKRVVALAGDRVEVRCSRLYRNGVAVPSEPVGGPCSYDDFDDRSGGWAKVDCQRRREHLGDATFDVYASPEETFDRPAAHDFPEPSPDDAGFACHVDRRSAEQRSRAAGQVVTRADVPADDTCAQRAHFVVPPGHVFVMGDNRDNSSDSRMWGPVPLDHVKARVARVWWSSGPLGIRWDRLGALD